MANDFSSDSNAIALYNFESGALTTDSNGTNTLTSYNSPSANTTNFKQGSASVDLTGSTLDHFSILDTDMGTNFPLKYGTGNDVFSACGWFYPDAAGTMCLLSKRDTELSFYAHVSSDGFNLKVSADGTTWTTLFEDLGTYSASSWYHYNVTFDGFSWTFRVWGDTEGAEVASSSGTLTTAIYDAEVPWNIGYYTDDWAAFDGKMDEIVFFNKVVTDTEQDSIIAGTYIGTASSYTLVYAGNGFDGGTIPVDSSSPYDSGATVTVLGNSGNLTLTDYTWNGWNTASDGTGTAYVETDTFTISSDTTLYAVWDAQTIQGITYDKDQEIEPSVTISLFSTTGSGVYAYVDATTSDATTGAFSFTLADTTLDYMIVAYLEDTTDTFDSSVNTVYSGDIVNFYLRSQADKTTSTSTGGVINDGFNGGFNG